VIIQQPESAEPGEHQRVRRQGPSSVLLSRSCVFVPGLDGPVALGGDGQFRGLVLVVQREAGLRVAAAGDEPAAADPGDALAWSR
jgi:hypothetical protein